MSAPVTSGDSPRTCDVSALTLRRLGNVPWRTRREPGRVGAMARLPRYALGGEFHHVTGRATGGILLYVDDEDRLRFRNELRSTLRVFDLKCHAWCLMGTHYHVLVGGAVERLSR